MKNEELGADKLTFFVAEAETSRFEPVSRSAVFEEPMEIDALYLIFLRRVLLILPP